MPQLSRCLSCKAPILWVKSAKSGANMPLDAEPVCDAADPVGPQTGMIAIVNGLGHVLTGELFETAAEEMMSGPRYRSHFSTCPNAARHRKKGGK